MAAIAAAMAADGNPEELNAAQREAVNPHSVLRQLFNCGANVHGIAP